MLDKPSPDNECCVAHIQAYMYVRTHGIDEISNIIYIYMNAVYSLPQQYKNVWLARCIYMAIWQSVTISNSVTLMLLAGKPAFGGLPCYGAPAKAAQRQRVDASASTMTAWGPEH